VGSIGRTITSRTARVLALSAALAGIAALLQQVVLSNRAPAFEHPGHPLLALVAGFAVAECLVVHLEFRREVHSISMSELPLVLGLLLFPPGQLLGARLLGAAVALVLHRRQVSVKLIFNLSNFALETTLAAAIYFTTIGSNSVFGPTGIALAFFSLAVANLVCASTVIAAVSIYERRIQREMFALVGPLAISCLANTTLALVAAALVIHEPIVAWLLLGLLAFAYAGFRAHAGLRQRYAGLELLYDFTRSVGSSRPTDEALAIVLGQAAELLRAERAEILLLGEGGEAGTISWLGDDGSLASRRADLDDGTSLELLAVERDAAVLAPRATRDPHLLPRLTARGYKDAIVIPLRREADVVGTFLVADRLGHVSTFDAEDLKLFEAVTAHTSAALENGHLIDRLRREAASKEHQSLHDSLTGLANRTLFHKVVSSTLARRPTCAAVMLMDLDRFKEINDTLGHHTGDRLLIEISARLGHILDSCGQVARLGGDEFAIFLHAVADVTDAETIARLILAALERPFVLGDLTLEIGASIGVAMYPVHAEESSTLLQRADVAMYEAKSGHLGYAVYAAERDQSNPRRLSLAAELRAAIDTGDLSVNYQPKADLVAGQIVAVEALVRWNHPRYGSLPPDEFIPLAEHTGLIRPLTEFVLTQSLQQCRAWADLGIDLAVAVNLSARSLIDTDLPASIEALLASTGVPARRLTLEITESMMMADPVRALETMHRLAGMGISLSIDDFGTGYSSLSYLKRLPVHEVKIDKSFVLSMTVEEDDATIVRSIVDLARNLRLRVVAEGVEDAQSLAALSALGCDIVQGYYLSRPMAAEALTAALVADGTALTSWVRSWPHLQVPERRLRLLDHSVRT
jgi:diguanylate cyclase (GGDEF)-like protein